MASRVQIQIVTWNSREHLERLFAGIDKQAGVDFNVVVIDNASTDGTVECVKGERTVRLIQNQENRGFAAAHNQGFAVCRASYVLVLNPDVELQAGYLTKVVGVIESDKKIAAAQGKLYRELPREAKFGILDCCGLKMNITGELINIGENELDGARFSIQREIFGVTGACALYQLEALKQVEDEHGIFDERFGSYKEDVDLAWRLKRAGWKAVFVPQAMALHQRVVRKGERAGRSDVVKRLSLRNHLLMIKKNLSWRDWWRLPFIVGYEVTKFVYVVLFERQSVVAYRNW